MRFWLSIITPLGEKMDNAYTLAQPMKPCRLSQPESTNNEIALELLRIDINRENIKINIVDQIGHMSPDPSNIANCEVVQNYIYPRSSISNVLVYKGGMRKHCEHKISCRNTG